MATRRDIEQQQDKLKVKAEILKLRVRMQEDRDKVKALRSRLNSMGSRIRV